MGHSWTLYTPLTTKEALAIVENVYEQLERIVGPELMAATDDDGYPEALGRWPEIEVSKSAIPTAAEERKALEDPSHRGASFEAAALDRLAKCRSRIEIERPVGFDKDPTLVTSVKLLLRAAKSSVFCKDRGYDLATSETVLRDLEDKRDLPAALHDYEADEEDADEDEDLEDLDEEEEEIEETEETTAAALHRMLATISEHAPTRRRVGEALERATPDVQSFARHLAQRGPTTDEAAAVALKLDVRAVGKARRALAELLERAERRR